MSLNLINYSWIPVRRKDGSRVTIAPWQMADATLAFPDWPRVDLNIACLEFLIGLVFVADPPSDVEDWQDRQTPDPERLRERLSHFARAFNLLGDGPRFMQDCETFEVGVKDPKTPDMLFIDSAGEQTQRNNADLMVKCDRYPMLDYPLAAMALFTLQAHAPSGGKGNRTSMRGGGPLITLVEPRDGLWPLIWANTPDGSSAQPDVLPWMRPSRTSERDQKVFPQDAHPAEALFGMPRRLRLVAAEEQISGVVQRPYGANYAGWEHPLTPHYRVASGSELFPRHPRAGTFGYRNWLGINASPPPDADDLARRAEIVRAWGGRSGRRPDVIIAGWAMDNMKPLDFLFSRVPLVTLESEAAGRMAGLVKAADRFAAALRGALSTARAEGEAREALQEDFYARTQSAFEDRLSDLQSDAPDWERIARQWLNDMRKVALSIFDAAAIAGLADRDVGDQGKIINALRELRAAFDGKGKPGREAFVALDLPVPEQGKKKGIPA